jgi:hypothetical protein
MEGRRRSGSRVLLGPASDFSSPEKSFASTMSVQGYHSVICWIVESLISFFDDSSILLSSTAVGMEPQPQLAWTSCASRAGCAGPLNMAIQLRANGRLACEVGREERRTHLRGASRDLKGGASCNCGVPSRRSAQMEKFKRLLTFNRVGCILCIELHLYSFLLPALTSSPVCLDHVFVIGPGLAVRTNRLRLPLRGFEGLSFSAVVLNRHPVCSYSRAYGPFHLGGVHHEEQTQSRPVKM